MEVPEVTVRIIVDRNVQDYEEKNNNNKIK